MNSNKFLFTMGIIYLTILVIGLLLLTNCTSVPTKNEGNKNPKDRGTCVRIGPKGKEIIEPCWR